VIAALGTAFYMWRLYFLVFAGESRSEPAKHAHESPASMTVPLLVLAGFATIAGVIGLPHLGHAEGHDTSMLQAVIHALDNWLKPSVTEEWYHSNVPGPQEIAGPVSSATTIVLMAVALLVSLAGIAGAWLFYGHGPSRTVARWAEHGAFADLYKASKAKLWVDELYDLILVRPFKVVARGLFEIVDRFVIDTVAVNGSAFVIGIFGRVSRWFQNGNVQRYLVGVVAGGALVFAISDCRKQPTFDYTIVGNQIQLHADLGSGMLGAAKIYWDLDGNGEKDKDPARPGEWLNKRDVTVTGYDGPITMWIEDPVTRREIKVTKTINLNAASESQGGK
jgi:NADH-quinone oxidoreductase subunit L